MTTTPQNSDALALPLTDDEIWRAWITRPIVPDGEDDSMEAQFVAACRAAIVLDRAQRPQAEPSSPPSLPHPITNMLVGDDSEDVFTADQMNERWADGWKTGYKHGAWADQRPQAGVEAVSPADEEKLEAVEKVAQRLREHIKWMRNGMEGVGPKCVNLYDMQVMLPVLEEFCSKQDATQTAAVGASSAPVAWTLSFNGRPINAKTTFDTREEAQRYADKCMEPDVCDPNPNPVYVIPLYAGSAPVVEPVAWEAKILGKWTATRHPETLRGDGYEVRAVNATISAAAAIPDVAKMVEQAKLNLRAITTSCLFRDRLDREMAGDLGEKIDSALDALGAAATQAKASVSAEWLPIETAPQTGRTILLGYFNAPGKWRTLRGQWFTDAVIQEEWTHSDVHEAGWFETSVECDDEDSGCWPTDPTHWQPLPAQPPKD